LNFIALLYLGIFPWIMLTVTESVLFEIVDVDRICIASIRFVLIRFVFTSRHETTVNPPIEIETELTRTAA
jgi:hypothetical protein